MIISRPCSFPLSHPSHDLQRRVIKLTEETLLSQRIRLCQQQNKARQNKECGRLRNLTERCGAEQKGPNWNLINKATLCRDTNSNFKASSQVFANSTYSIYLSSVKSERKDIFYEKLKHNLRVTKRDQPMCVFFFK